MSDTNKRLDELATLNKMAHPELDGACYICGINPSLIKQLMVDEFEKLIGEDTYDERDDHDTLRRQLRQKLKEWKEGV